MHPLSVEEAMKYPWQPTFEECQDGGWRVSVLGLPDFEIFAPTEQQLRAELRDALSSHLMGYLQVGKVIPVTSFEPSSGTPTASTPKAELFTLTQDGDKLALV